MCRLIREIDKDGELLAFTIASECHATRNALAEWLRFHGVDPANVPVTGCIDRDTTHRAIHVMELDATGNSVVRTYQGETEPTEFPAIVLAQAEICLVKQRGHSYLAGPTTRSTLETGINNG